MHYTVYRITNEINGKIYIGKHQTKDLNDSYMGSGKLIKRSIDTYGVENFSKEILFIFESEELMNAKEKELVTEEFCLREDTYNICVGGQGGFSYINREGLAKGIMFLCSKEHKINGAKGGISANQKYGKGLIAKSSSARKRTGNTFATFSGKKHTIDSKQKISAALKNKGLRELNSQFGTMWIHDGINERKIRNNEPIPNNWRKGRKR